MADPGAAPAEEEAVDEAAFREAVAHFATGVTVITTITTAGRRG